VSREVDQLVASTARNIVNLNTEQSAARAREEHLKTAKDDTKSSLKESIDDVSYFKKQLDQSRSELDPGKLLRNDQDHDVLYRLANTNIPADWSKIFKRFAEASLPGPINLARGIGSMGAATSPATALLRTVYGYVSAIGVDQDEVNNRKDKAAERQSEQSEQVKDADDETHALTILRHLKRPARSLDVHLSARDGHPDWDGLWGKSPYTGNQPWPIEMIETEITRISNRHATDSSAARLSADDMVQALAGVWIFEHPFAYSADNEAFQLVQDIRRFKDDDYDMGKAKIPVETVKKWQDASATIRKNVQEHTHVRVEAVLALNKKNVRTHGWETSVFC
jgi:hypothetical protein